MHPGVHVDLDPDVHVDLVIDPCCWTRYNKNSQ